MHECLQRCHNPGDISKREQERTKINVDTLIHYIEVLLYNITFV